jgi:hypothetical protein
MSTQRKPNTIHKNAVRCALITAATVSTLIGAQTLAFSQQLADLQAQNEVADVIVTPTSMNYQDSPALPTLVPSSTPLPSAAPTRGYGLITFEPKQIQGLSAQPTLVPTQLPTTQPTIQPSATVVPTIVQPTAVPQVRTARNQPRPRSESSKP